MWQLYLKRTCPINRLRKEQHTEQFLFTNIKGNLIQYRSLSHNFKTYVEKHNEYNLPRITFHMLRHSYGSLLLEKGVPLVTISKLLGHEDISTTADIYISITEQLEKQAKCKCEDILRDVNKLSRAIDSISQLKGTITQ